MMSSGLDALPLVENVTVLMSEVELRVSQATPYTIKAVDRSYVAH